MSADSSISVLIVDDSIMELEAIQEQLKHERNYKIKAVTNAKEFVRSLQDRPDVCIVDLFLDDSNEPEGHTLVRLARERLSDASIVVRSSLDSSEHLLQALREGADDFISKRTDTGELALRIRSALAKRRSLSSVGVDHPGRIEVAGNAMKRIQTQVPNIVNSAIRAVYVYGETGTGKEVVADLFAAQVGAGKPFIRVNCGAITPTLLESELFGHVKGAFTGAQANRAGYFSRAHGGWIFLDEVSQLSNSAQTALLRVIENQEVLRVGATTPEKIDVRVLCAANEDLDDLVQRGKFRKDLLQRLGERTINLPPLRERKDEIDELISFFCRQMPGGPYRCTPSVRELLTSLKWDQGNVRELRGVLRAMTEFAFAKELTPASFPERLLKSTDKKPSHNNFTGGQRDFIKVPRREGKTYDDLCDDLLLELIAEVGEKNGATSLRQMAQIIGIPKTTLASKIEKIKSKDIEGFAKIEKLLSNQT